MWMIRSEAMLAELQPATATEAMLAAQMVGTQRAAMTFLERAMNPDQTLAGVDANVLRATRLMRLFTEQVDTMAKLKGKGGQQRVVVEHVNVAPAVRRLSASSYRGGGGPLPTIMDEPHVQRRGSLRNGNPPGDLSKARRCGATTRRQTACAQPAIWNRRRCRLHGGRARGHAQLRALSGVDARARSTGRIHVKCGSFSRTTGDAGGNCGRCSATTPS